MNQEKIGKLIKKIRTENHLTQAEFAEKYGVTYQAVSKWENGKNIPDISLIKQMSKDFNIDIEDILEGKKNIKKKHKLPIILLIIFIIIISIILINREGNFSFKTLSSECKSFEIKGSIAYNNKKSSIYISDIDYCEEKDEEKYKKIECILYEKEADQETEISKATYNKNEPIKLEEYLKELNMKIDDYSRTCKKYTKNSLYLIIKATKENNKTKTYRIPLSLNDNC